MDKEFFVTEVMRNQDFDAIDKALNEVKDRIILLKIARDYLCEDRFLIKIGLAIEQNIDDLEKGINILKKNSVGRRFDEIDLRLYMIPVRETAKRLQALDARLKEHCVDGRLGKELYEKLVSLVSGVKDFKKILQGENVDYTATEMAVGLLGRLKFIVIGFTTTSKLALKLAGVAVLAGVMAFAYLFFNMVDKEKKLLTVIQQQERMVLISEKAISKIGAELDRLREDIDRIKTVKSTRKEEIKLLELSVQEHDLEERYRKAAVERELFNKELGESKNQLKEMEEKPYLKKLLGM